MLVSVSSTRTIVDIVLEGVREDASGLGRTGPSSEPKYGGIFFTCLWYAPCNLLILTCARCGDRDRRINAIGTCEF